MKGSITPEGDYSVHIAGSGVPRDLARNGWGFSGDIAIDENVKDVEVLVEDQRGSSRRLLLPIK